MKCVTCWWTVIAVLLLGPSVGCSSTDGTGNGGAGGAGGSGGVAASCSSSLLSAEPFLSLDESVRMWRVVYTSESIDGTPIEVSGVVATAAEPLSGELRDVVSYAHGTTGLFDPCAPSVTPTYPFFRLTLPELVAAGYVVTVTDYEGLGTPGLHPYYVGVSEGRGVVDIACAAQQLEEVHASNRVVVWGSSQGGHAALFAGEVAPAWEPGIDVLGVISAAPGSELIEIFESGAPDTPTAKGYLWQMTLGLEAAYPGLSVEDVYTAEALATIDRLVEQEACNFVFLATAGPFENAGFKTNPVDLPLWPELLEANSPGNTLSEMPILVLQGIEDPVVPIRFTDLLFERLCKTGSQAEYRTFEGGTHNVLNENLPAALEWTAARFAGEGALSTCPN